LFLKHPSAKFFDENGDRASGKKKEGKPERKKGDISIELWHKDQIPLDVADFVRDVDKSIGLYRQCSGSRLLRGAWNQTKEKPNH
jgi:hypothetical protein